MNIEKVIISSKDNTKKEFKDFEEATVYVDKFPEKKKGDLKFIVKVDGKIVNLSDADSFLYALNYDMGRQEGIKEALEIIKARAQDLEILLSLKEGDFKNLRNQFDRAQFGESYEEGD